MGEVFLNHLSAIMKLDTNINPMLFFCEDTYLQRTLAHTPSCIIPLILLSEVWSPFIVWNWGNTVEFLTVRSFPSLFSWQMFHLLFHNQLGKHLVCRSRAEEVPQNSLILKSVCHFYILLILFNLAHEFSLGNPTLLSALSRTDVNHVMYNSHETYLKTVS